MKQNFQARLTELRTFANLSREKLAKEIGVTKKAIEFWEKGINEPKLSYIIALAKFFGVTTDYLLCLED